MTRARELSKLINTNSFSVDSDFNVGIGSTSPDVKLDVGGAVLVTGISTFENTTQSTSSTTGALIVSGGVGIAKSLNVGGNLSVAGTITYDDVTNIDSVGIVTAQSGINIVGGGLTVTGVSTFFNDVITGTGSTVGFGSTAFFPDGAKAVFGDGEDLQIYHDGSNSYTDHVGTNSYFIRNFTNDQGIVLQTDDGSGGLANYVQCHGGEGKVKLFHYGNQKFETTTDGVVITGIVTATSFEGSGANLTNLPASGDSNDITACLFI